MTEKRFKLYEHKDIDYIIYNPHEHLDFMEMLGDALTSEEIVDLLNELHEENQKLYLDNAELKCTNKTLYNKNEQLRQQIKDLRINTLDSIHEADEIKCTCNPCVVEECVKRVVE